MKTYEFIRTADHDELVDFILYVLHYMTEGEDLTADRIEALYNQFWADDGYIA